MSRRPEPLPRFVRAASLLGALGLGVGVAAVLVTGHVIATCATKVTTLAARGMIKVVTDIAPRIF